MEPERRAMDALDPVLDACTPRIRQDLLEQEASVLPHVMGPNGWNDTMINIWRSYGCPYRHADGLFYWHPTACHPGYWRVARLGPPPPWMAAAPGEYERVTGLTPEQVAALPPREDTLHHQPGWTAGQFAAWYECGRPHRDSEGFYDIYCGANQPWDVEVLLHRLGHLPRRPWAATPHQTALNYLSFPLTVRHLFPRLHGFVTTRTETVWESADISRHATTLHPDFNAHMLQRVYEFAAVALMDGRFLVREDVIRQWGLPPPYIRVAWEGLGDVYPRMDPVHMRATCPPNAPEDLHIDPGWTDAQVADWYAYDRPTRDAEGYYTVLYTGRYPIDLLMARFGHLRRRPWDLSDATALALRTLAIPEPYLCRHGGELHGYHFVRNPLLTPYDITARTREQHPEWNSWMCETAQAYAAVPLTDGRFLVLRSRIAELGYPPEYLRVAWAGNGAYPPMEEAEVRASVARRHPHARADFSEEVWGIWYELGQPEADADGCYVIVLTPEQVAAIDAWVPKIQHLPRAPGREPVIPLGYDNLARYVNQLSGVLLPRLPTRPLRPERYAGAEPQPVTVDGGGGAPVCAGLAGVYLPTPTPVAVTISPGNQPGQAIVGGTAQLWRGSGGAVSVAGAFGGSSNWGGMIRFGRHF